MMPVSVDALKWNTLRKVSCYVCTRGLYAFPGGSRRLTSSCCIAGYLEYHIRVIGSDGDTAPSGITQPTCQLSPLPSHTDTRHIT